MFKQYLWEKNKDICENKKITNITYGFDDRSDWKIIDINRITNYTNVTLKNNNNKFNFKCKLIANYEIEKLVGAIILAKLNGLKIKQILESIRSIKKSKGRLNKISIKPKIFSIYIDYAHTPEALKKLKCFKVVKNPEARLVLVFGCGGNRDKGKRKMMGKVTRKFADIVFITDDNPRYENPASIRNEIAAHCKNQLM